VTLLYTFLRLEINEDIQVMMRDIKSNVLTYIVGEKGSQFLRQVEREIVSEERCRRVTCGFRIENVVCITYPAIHEDSFQGDAGGPLVCGDGTRWWQYGVIHGFYYDLGRHKPGVCMNVVTFLPWITAKTGSQHHTCLLIVVVHPVVSRIVRRE